MPRPGTKLGVNTAPNVNVLAVSCVRSGLPELNPPIDCSWIWLYWNFPFAAIVAAMPGFARQRAPRAPPLVAVRPPGMLHGSLTTGNVCEGCVNSSEMFGARTAFAYW